MDNPIAIGDVPPDLTIPVLPDGPPMDLPSGCTINPDGSVTLTLDYPCSVKYRVPGTDQVVKEDRYDSLTLRRLTGADVRKIIAAKNPTSTALALSTGLGAGKLALFQNVADASDDAAASDVVNELLGGIKAALPAHAEETADGILLPLFRPVEDDAGTLCRELLFKRLTAAQRRQASEAPNLLDWGVALSAGVTPKEAKALVDAMDGADAMAVNRVVLFLCGSGRRTSG